MAHAVGAALSGAAINAVVAKRAHGADHSNHDHGHSHGMGAAVDAKIHMLTDMGTAPRTQAHSYLSHMYQVYQTRFFY